MASDRSRTAASAVNRFGLGARPGDLSQVTDPEAWVLAQLHRPVAGTALLGDLPTSLDYLRREGVVNRKRRDLRREHRAVPDKTLGPDGKPVNPLAEIYREEFGADLQREAAARWRLAAVTDTPFAERLVRFWSNHFAVSVDKGPAHLYAAPFEREAIRPHWNGRFIDLLLAVETHPAMLRYLDQAQSVGPDSTLARRLDRRLARRARRADQPPRQLGLNENLAREIMELHTLGVGAHYSQGDVTEFARALTGWSMPFPGQLERGDFDSAFLYRAAAHEPGARTVMGKRYEDTGFDQARAIMADFAVHPATAQHLSLELARHLVADDPPAPLVERMAAAYLRSDGYLPAMYAVLIHAPESWAPTAIKFRTPQDYLVAGIRGGNIAIGDSPQPFEAWANRLGQPTFMPRSPAGFSDVAADWIGADALWKRIQTAEALAVRVPRAGIDPHAFGRALLGSNLRGDTAQAMARAEAPEQAIAIAFASPEFQWRA